MNRMITIPLTGALTLAASAFGNWQLVDNFQSGQLDESWFVGFREDSGEGGGLDVIADPADASNLIGSFTPGVANSTGAYNVRAYLPIPPIAPDNTASTLYLRFKLPSVEFGGQQFIAQVDSVWGLTAVEEPAGYGDYSTLMRVEFDNSFDVYDGTAYNVIQDQLTADVWYEVWMVINHSTRQYRVYAKGGPEFPEQVQIFPTTGDWTNYRNPAVEPLTKLLLLSSAGTASAVKGIDPFYLDDIYVDTTGINLTSGGSGGGCTPAPGVFSDYCLGELNWVDTGAYMGWVNVVHYPWIWIDSLKKWGYAGGGASSGAWLYIIK